MIKEVSSKSISYNNIDWTAGSFHLKIDKFEIKRGQIILVLGESGSGKSSLMKWMAGILDDDEDYTVAINEKIPPVYLMQNPNYQIIHNNVKQEILFPLKNRGLETNEREKKLNELSDSFKLSHLLDRNTRNLSLGELQMLMLAASFAMESPLLLLDEPASHLGAKRRNILMQEIKNYVQKGRSVIMSSQISDDYKYADQIIVMQKGKIIADFPAADYKKYENMLIDLGLISTGDKPCG